MNAAEKNVTGDSGIDDRVATRHLTINFVWYKIIEDEEDSERQDEGISKSSDLSETGVGILMTRLIPKGKKVFIEIATKNFNISAVGKIVYTKYEEEGFYRVGIQFIVIPPNDLLLLKKHFGRHG